MTDAVPPGWRNLVDWQRLVAGPLNKMSQGYPFPLWDAEPADANEGYVFYDTQDHAPKWFDGTDYKTFAATDDLGAGWTQIATSSPSGVSSVTFSTIPTTYSDLFVSISAASHNSGSNQLLRIAISPDGTTFSAFPVSFSPSVSAATGLYGGVLIPRYGDNQGMMTLTAGDNGANGFGSGAGASWPWRCAGISALRLSFTAGNFDAGTFTLYGR